MIIRIACIVSGLLAACAFAVGDPIQLRSGSLTAAVKQQAEVAHVKLHGPGDAIYADGPLVCEFEVDGQPRISLKVQRVERSQDAIVTEAVGAALHMRHELRPTRIGGYAGFIERITVRNTGATPLRVRDYEVALQRPVAAGDQLRAVAVPFRRNADGRLRDWSIEEIAAGKAANPEFRNDPAVHVSPVVDSPRGRLRSEAWVLTDGNQGLLVAKYNTDDIEFSMLSARGGEEARLRFGGSSFALHSEPESMQSLAPGATVRLGDTYYFPVEGWESGYARFKSLLNALGHGLSARYDPPVNWNELFDIGWYHSDPAALRQHYTRDALLREAAKARDVGATALYLDPGWEVCEGTTLWAEDRLGPAAELVKTLEKDFGLALAFRTIGRVYRDEFPRAWYVQHQPETRPYERPCLDASPEPEPVPHVDERGARNLALLPTARASASSCLQGYAIHQVAHLNDGWYGNAASWISAGEPSWAEIDLGAVYRIDRIRLGSEHTPHFHDRTPVDVRVVVATEAAEARWNTVAQSASEPIGMTRTIRFAPCDARRVRVEVASATGGQARIDEIEVYEAVPQPWSETPRQRVLPAASASACNRIAFWEPCTLNPSWQKEKLERIAKVVSAGMTFAMFDEFDWRGPCYSPGHGHAVPSTPEGHTRAVYGLVREIKRRFPGLLVEAHDPVWPWGVRYLPVYFDQTLDPSARSGSYDENWGFEFMWNPIEDLVSGRALCLYYYNLGCDIPLYDHITAEKDNDACLAFWWYASTVRHLGIGGKKGLDSAGENQARWAAYKHAMSHYRRLREWFVRGRFLGIDELAHLHVLEGRPGGVLVVFNLEKQQVTRTVPLEPADLGADARPLTASQGRLVEEEGRLKLTVSIPAMSPLVIELTAP